MPHTSLMTDLHTMLSENQVKLDRTLERLEKAGLPEATKATALEILHRIEQGLKFSRRVSKDRQEKSPAEIAKEIDTRTAAAPVQR